MTPLRIAENIIELRHKKGITQEELASFLNVTKASVSKWETGQSCPDILLLPQIAAFFDITIDKLMGYEPQMSQEQIKKCYLDLADEFSREPFEKVMGKSMELVREYYSCYPFLLQMAVLWLNHYMLTDDKDRQKEILLEIRTLCDRICDGSRDVSMNNDALILKAGIALTLGDAEETIEILKPLTDVNGLRNQNADILIQAYQILGQHEEADYNSQIIAFTHLISLVGISIRLMDIHIEEAEFCEETIRRTQQIISAYELERLHPNITLQFYFETAVFYCVHNEKEKALKELEKFVNGTLAFLKEGPLLRGDMYFNRLEEWFEELVLGKEAPRSREIILEGVVQALEYPSFEILFKEKRFRNLKKLLKGKGDVSI